MKLKIEKTEKGVELEFSASPRSKPVKGIFTEAEIRSITKMLELAAQSDNFSITYAADH